MIIGAGFAGLIAAHIFPREVVCEANPAPAQMHRALLRFRTNAVAHVVGIDFREVQVRKGIWLDGAYVAPSIATANLYSRKCLGQLLGDRSIWNLDPVKRYVAPETFYEQLVEHLGSRVKWGVPVQLVANDRNSGQISTMPLPTTLKQLGIDAGVGFARAPISVIRFRAPRCDVHQTVYFPSLDHTLYRASITGDLLICEFADRPAGAWMEDVERAFALPQDYVPIDVVKQSFGKIAPIEDGLRKRLLHKLTVDHGILSLGRFATWRNIPLDDIVQDCAVLKKLREAGAYERSLKSL